MLNKEAKAWCLFDWANSPFTTLVITFVYATYFAKAIAPDPTVGATWWSRGITISAIIIALLAPFVGRITDATATRKRGLLIATVVCAIASAALGFVAPSTNNAVLLSLLFLIIANVAFEIQMSLYNSFLVHLVPSNQVGRWSALGWGVGYLGGLCCMALALAAFVMSPTWLGIPTAEGLNVRATNWLVAGWLLIFSLPFFWWVPEPNAHQHSMRRPFLDAWLAFRSLRQFPIVIRFLIARLFFNDGLVTIFAFGGIYASVAFNMDTQQVLVFGIVINLAAGLGSLSSARLADVLGAKQSILISLGLLCAAVVMAALSKNSIGLWIAGVLIGLAAGPNQAASRTFLAEVAPKERQGEFFGLFALSGKLTAFLGPLVLGLVTDLTHNLRVGITSVLVFFVVGALLLIPIKPTPTRVR